MRRWLTSFESDPPPESVQPGYGGAAAQARGIATSMWLATRTRAAPEKWPHATTPQTIKVRHEHGALPVASRHLQFPK